MNIVIRKLNRNLGVYVSHAGKEWYERIKKPDGWVPLDAFDIHSVDDAKKLLYHPYEYSFYYTNKFICMCAMFYVGENTLGISCTIHRSDRFNKAYYYANGEYIGCIPYKHTYYKYAYIFDRLFFTIYRGDCIPE